MGSSASGGCYGCVTRRRGTSRSRLRNVIETTTAAWRIGAGFSGDPIPRQGRPANTKGQAKLCLTWVLIGAPSGFRTPDPLSLASHLSACSPTNRIDHARASDRGARNAGVHKRVEHLTVGLAQPRHHSNCHVGEHDPFTADANSLTDRAPLRACASSAMRIRSGRVSTPKRAARPSAPSPCAPRGSCSRPTTVISSRSTTTSGSSVNHPPRRQNRARAGHFRAGWGQWRPRPRPARAAGRREEPV